MFDLPDWENLNGSAWRKKFSKELTYHLTKGQELQKYASDFGVKQYPTAILIGVDYKVRSLDAAWPVSVLPGNLDKAIAEMASGIKQSVSEMNITLNNYPNPFNPVTTINYSIEVKNLLPVNLSVYNANGELLKTLVNEIQKPGNYSVKFDGSNLNSGVYYYKLNTPDKIITKKMILIK